MNFISHFTLSKLRNKKRIWSYFHWIIVILMLNRIRLHSMILNWLINIFFTLIQINSMLNKSKMKNKKQKSMMSLFFLFDFFSKATCCNGEAKAIEEGRRWEEVPHCKTATTPTATTTITKLCSCTSYFA